MYRHTHTRMDIHNVCTHTHTHTHTHRTHIAYRHAHTQTPITCVYIHIIACFSSLFIIYFKLLSTMVLPLWVSSELFHGTVSSELGNHKTNCLASNMKSYPHTQSHTVTHTHIYYTRINVHAIGLIRTHTQRQ